METSVTSYETVDVCIVGMGIGGLATAIALQQAGISVIATEKDSYFMDRRQGYGLTLTNSISGPLAKMGLLEECINNNCLSSSHFIFDGKGKVLGYYGRAFRKSKEIDNNQGGNRGNLRIPRQKLRDIMLKRLSPDILRWGYRFEGVTIDPDGLLRTTFRFIGENRVVRSRVLVGADGIRSSVRLFRDSKLSTDMLSPLRFLNVSVILGISKISHPLLYSKGFYCLDGKSRLFTMPYHTPPEEEDSDDTCPQIMWQLSFACLEEAEALALRSKSFHEILSEALSIVSEWTVPGVTELINSTLPGEVWATPLYDRDRMIVHKPNDQSILNGITVIGDACHPMSMFKGQGANQALEDAVLLAEKLSELLEDKIVSGDTGNADKIDGSRVSCKRPRDEELAVSAPQLSLDKVNNSTLNTKLRVFEREMVARAEKKVLGSRAAAHHLHEPSVLNDDFGISGVSIENLQRVLQRLSQENLTASKLENLEVDIKLLLENEGLI